MAVISRNRRGRIFKHFLESEKAGGIFLILCTVISLVLSNSPVSESYTHFWHLPLHLSFSAIAIDFSLEDWINDGLMTIFFLMVGLEIERELYVGELSVRKNALLPIIGAIGGMAFPALIHFFFNRNTPTQAAIGIPIATDIAFTLGLLSLIGSRVPSSLKIFLTALAIIDDLGAIIIIAVFYSKGFSLFHFSIAIAIFGLLQVFNRMKIKRIAIYLTGGVFMWYFMLKSGVHSTITGVLLAFCIPFDKDDESNPSQQLQLDLHNIVNYVIIPVFALANTGIRLHPEWWRSLAQNNSLGIIAGLVAGKPLGIFSFTALGVWLKITKLPGEINWKMIFGSGMLAGIGFTMSIFIANLALAGNPGEINNSKLAILTGSLISALSGLLVLYLFLRTDSGSKNKLASPGGTQFAE